MSGISDWAHPSATSGKSGDIVTFTISPNNEEEKRIATFKFFTGSAVVPLTIESAPGYSLDLLSGKEVFIRKEKGEIMVQVNTNIAEPTITCSEEWLTFNKRTDFAGRTTFAFTATANEGYTPREATITIASPLSESPINVKVWQAQTDAIIPEAESFIYDLSARTISFKLSYNVEHSIEITNGSDWITDQQVSEPQQESNGLQSVTLSYKLDAATVTRAGAILVKGTGGASCEISIAQKDPDVQLIKIPDAKFRTTLLNNKWILVVGGSQCIVLEKGLKATSFSNPNFSSQIEDITGIEGFPNLTSINLGYCANMKKMDISGLHKVSSLSYRSTQYCEVFNLGDNPITYFDAGGEYNTYKSTSMKIIGSNLETINMSLNSWYVSYDELTSIDVSECPALKSLNIKRSDKLKTLYLKKGQEIPNLTKNDATEIVYKD